MMSDVMTQQYIYAHSNNDMDIVFKVFYLHNGHNDSEKSPCDFLISYFRSWQWQWRLTLKSSIFLQKIMKLWKV